MNTYNMDNETLNIQISFQSLDNKDQLYLRELCRKHHKFTYSQTKGVDGCIQDVVYFIIDTTKEIDLKDVIIGGALWDLIKFITKAGYTGLMTLWANGKKRKYSKSEQLIKDLGNYISKIIYNSDTLYGVTEKCVMQYNKEYGENISLNLNSGFDEKYLQIDIENNTIFINRRIFVYLTSYFFGSSKLSHLYKLTWDLIQLDYIDEAEVLYSKFISELHKQKTRIEKFIGINPQWLTMQIYVTILHELGHHRYKIAPHEFEDRSIFVKVALTESIDNIEAAQDIQLILRNLSDLSEESEVKEALIAFYRQLLPELPAFYKEIASELLCDKDFVEELIVDYFAFEHLIDAVLATSDSKLILANILAALTANSWYIEYSKRLDTLSQNPNNSDKRERIALGFINHVQQRLRASVREHFISIYLKEISDDKNAMDLYKNLTTSVYLENNGNFDVGFLKDLDQYYVIMRQGTNPQYNDLNRDCLESKMNVVESEIISLISDGLANAHTLKEA